MNTILLLIAQNILVFMLDDVGRDYVNIYGENPAPPQTQHMDALARQGLFFQNA